MGKELKIMMIIGAVVLGGGVLLAFKTNRPATPQGQVGKNLLVRADSSATGSRDAKVMLVEFGDYQCPACGVADPTVEKIIQDFQNNSNFSFVFRHFPLSQHANALMASESAEAAGAQGKFWQMHTKLYQSQSQWSDQKNPIDTFAGYAQELGLNVDQFKQDVLAKKYADKISQDQKDGLSVNLEATPTFFLNGVAAVGVPDYNNLKSEIQAALAK